jgi:hypothetical protein
VRIKLRRTDEKKHLPWVGFIKGRVKEGIWKGAQNRRFLYFEAVVLGGFTNTINETLSGGKK